MTTLNLKPTHKIIKNFYQKIAQLTEFNLSHEGAVASPFAEVLHHCASQCDLQLIEKYPLNRQSKYPIRTDGTLLDKFELRHGIWEAKDIKDNLSKAIQK